MSILEKLFGSFKKKEPVVASPTVKPVAQRKRGNDGRFAAVKKPVRKNAGRGR